MRRAFTLIEIMVVVTIVGIGAGLGLASLRPVAADVRMMGASRGLAALVRSARMHAMAHHARVQVTVSGSTIQLQSCPSKYGSVACATSTSFTNLPNQSIVLSSGDQAGVSFVSGPATPLVFAPTGLPEGTPTLRDYVIKTATRSSTVRVTPAGEVRVQ